MSYRQTEQEFLNKLGLRVRELRHAKGLSQEKLALLCGLHRTYVDAVERGERNISALNLLKVASSLGVTVSELFVDVEVGG